MTRYAGQGYGALKLDTAAALEAFVVPLKERFDMYMSDQAELENVLARGAERAREVATQTLADVYDRIGFLPARQP